MSYLSVPSEIRDCRRPLTIVTTSVFSLDSVPRITTTGSVETTALTSVPAGAVHDHFGLPLFAVSIACTLYVSKPQLTTATNCLPPAYPSSLHSPSPPFHSTFWS